MANLVKNSFSHFYRCFLVSKRIRANLCAVNNGNFAFAVREMATKKRKRNTKVLTMASVNQNLVKLRFTDKGPLMMRVQKHIAELKQGKQKPFNEVIFTNESDGHALGKSPITFLRQVLASCVYPHLLKSSKVPADVKQRAKCILHGCMGSSMGSYTDSQGMHVIRQHIADYIRDRDYGIESLPENIFIMDGTSPLITLILSMFCHDINSKKPGVLIPAPGYPLYSASLAHLSLYPVEYYLNEEQNWCLDIKELKRALEDSKCFCAPRAIVVINPGNPTGHVLTRKNIEDIIKFAYKENLVILADEVYQENVYDEFSEFHSFKKVKHELGRPYQNVELASFLSVSKGYIMECGLRGGCAEFDGFHKDVQAILVKAASVGLCSNTIGQVALSVMCKPPEEGDPSFEEFMREKCCILNGLAAKSKVLTENINRIGGLKANPIQGALYAFIKIDMPKGAISKAEKLNIEPDTLWCIELLDKTGIVVTPGSTFGQKPGTYHFRTTILPPFKVMRKVTEEIKKFQADFLKTFR